jgi:hypothetical protein
VDTGSTRSYISYDRAKLLFSDLDDKENISLTVQTFLKTELKNFKEALFGIKVQGQESFYLPLLIDDSISIQCHIPGLNTAIKNITKNKFSFADHSFNIDKDNSTYELDMIIGTDLIQFLKSFSLISCMNGKALCINNQISPVGNIEQFLYRSEIKIFHEQKKLQNVDSDPTLVNFVLNPQKSFFHPFNNILTDLEIDLGLEHIFSPESMGLDISKEMTSLDEDIILNFKNNITFDDNKYYIKIPWYEDRINSVPHNYNIALSVLNRVVQSLNNKNLIKEYGEVFKQYLEEGIIEKVSVDPSSLDKYVFVPHRPVVKVDAQTTTKIRPVFNCSLVNNKNSISLNQACFVGPDLLQPLLKLILNFRTNEFVLLSDIRKAYLMVRLREEEDRNRFCFLWYDDEDKVTVFRYNTLLFDLNCSSFVLNYLIKFHALKYPEDKCTEILCNNFYVDNLSFTGNNLNEMIALYETSCARMSQGGFDLRSWNSNNIDINNSLKSNGKFVTHGECREKILGYCFDTERDTLHINKVDYNKGANTKRKILSEISKLYDPIS